MSSICIIGSIHVDFIIRVPRIPSIGETILGEGFEIHPGGKGANQCIGVARLGVRASLVSRVGNDFLADMALKNLKTEDNVVLDYVSTVEGVHTGVAFILVDSSGDNIIAVAPGADMYVSRSDVDKVLKSIHGFKALLVQLEIPLDTVAYALEKFHEKDVLTILNPAPAVVLHESIYKYVDVLTPNSTELGILVGLDIGSLDDVIHASRKLLKAGVRIAVVTTLGANGAVVVTRNRVVHLPAFKVKAIDTTGAGDAFNAGLAVALTEGMGIIDAVLFANAVAALSTTKMGAQEGLPRRDDVEDFIKRHGLS